MKIAFVGKGGSGKSTLSALFIRHLLQQGRGVLAIDADLNMNLAGLLGLSYPADRYLADPAVAMTIRTHLKGENLRIASINSFLPTTPPGAGSNLIRSLQDNIIQRFSVQASGNSPLNLMTVGSYEDHGIGQTCYHSHLFVAENLLSHIVTGNNFDVVCDMVAGTDAFAYSLHLQFDALVLIAEPTPESAEVCKLYVNLARSAGIADLVHLVGNKVDGQDDIDFITENAIVAPLGFVPSLRTLKAARQRGKDITESLHSDQLSALLAKIDTAGRNPAIDEPMRLRMLCRLHEKLSEKQWVRLGHGDVAGQIDHHFLVREAV